ncbi:NUDIX domain-containing protein [Egibacter rhizosphaerae]|uniref:NUDIX domain-containing protein n=1 Tax=Egibacter rhizosphaerae TaxID=1670831 RepID=UPI0013F17440|nr:NUDIX hydrolase [Egibacter rhizosphaerae]
MNASDEPRQDIVCVDSRRAYEGVLSRVRIDVLESPDGTRFEREVVEHVDAVGIVAVTPEGEVVLLRQYRRPVGERLLEIPAGICDVVGEEAAGTAARELAEETGYAADRFEWLGAAWNSAGWTDERTELFLARDAVPQGHPQDFVAEAEEAAMDVVLLPLSDAVELVRGGAVPDAKTALGLLLAEGRVG